VRLLLDESLSPQLVRVLTDLFTVTIDTRAGFVTLAPE
jgi:predicted nuclease of predicted toxin-antitoxin system